MSRYEANTRLDNQVSRRNCQMFSTGFNSGARAGSSTSVRLSGTTRSWAQCHPARSISRTPWAPCPCCGTPFTKNSFACTPNDTAPTNLEIRCDNTDCDFTGNRALPVLTVDEPIYRRLPAFLVATVDKFASLPWEGQTGAFFGHVGRFQAGLGFFGAAEPRHGL